MAVKDVSVKDGVLILNDYNSSIGARIEIECTHNGLIVRAQVKGEWVAVGMIPASLNPKLTLDMTWGPNAIR